MYIFTLNLLMLGWIAVFCVACLWFLRRIW
jgi:hypothetical protein